MKKQILDQFIEHMQLAFKEHTLENEGEFFAAFKAYQACYERYLSISAEEYKPYEITKVNLREEVRLAFIRLAVAHENYQQANTSADFINHPAVKAFEKYFNDTHKLFMPAKNVKIKLIKFCEDYKKNIVDKDFGYLQDFEKRALFEDESNHDNVQKIPTNFYYESVEMDVTRFPTEFVGYSSDSSDTVSDFTENNSTEESNSEEISFIENFHSQFQTCFTELNPEAFCLYFLTTLLIKDYGLLSYHDFKDVFLTKVVEKSSLTPSHQRLLAEKCYELLENSSKNLDGSILSSFKTGEIIAAGTQILTKTLDLSKTDLNCFMDDPCKALATVYQFMELDSIIVDECLLDGLMWENLGDAFQINNLKVKRFCLTSHHKYDAPDFGESFVSCFVKMKVKLFGLSGNDLEKTDLDWWKNLAYMLDKAGTTTLDLYGTNIFNLSETLKKEVCNCLDKLENLKLINMDGSSKLTIFDSFLKKKHSASYAQGFFNKSSSSSEEKNSEPEKTFFRPTLITRHFGNF